MNHGLFFLSAATQAKWNPDCNWKTQIKCNWQVAFVERPDADGSVLSVDTRRYSGIFMINYGTEITSGIRGGNLPRDEPGGPARSDIQGRPGSGAVFGDSGASLPEDGLAGARVVFDGQSLSPGRGNAQGQSGGGDEMVFGDLHGAIQPAAQSIGADGGEGGSLALWGRATGIGRGKGATDRGRGDEEAGVGPSGSGAASERGPAEGANSAAAAAGDDHDIEMDSGEVEDGDMDPRNQPALPPEKVNLCQYSGPTRFRSVFGSIIAELLVRSGVHCVRVLDTRY